MSSTDSLESRLSLFSLREVRRYLRRSHAVMMTVTFVVLYALGSMLYGAMLILTSIPGGYTVDFLWGNALGQSPWNYPALLIVAPWGIVSLPFFPTVAMVVVSVGVGMGMAVAVLLGVALVRNRRHAGRPAGVGSIAGLTPAMIALVTLGACCSTTAAATAGVGLVAGTSGTTSNELLINNWYLGVFQIVVVWVALVAQELLLRVYGGLLGLTGSEESRPENPPAPMDRGFAVGAALRVALLVGGLTWSLAALAEAAELNGAAPSTAFWVRALVQHALPGVLAVLVAIFPAGMARLFLGSRRRWGAVVLRASLVVAGLTLLLGAPPPIAGWGIEGFGNELAWVLGGPGAWGAVAPVFPFGAYLTFRWVVQYLLVGGFAAAVGLAPRAAFDPLVRTVSPRAVRTPADRVGPGEQPSWASRASAVTVPETPVMAARPSPGPSTAAEAR